MEVQVLEKDSAFKHSAFVRYSEEWDYNGTVCQLFVDFKEANDSVMREVLYSLLLPMAFHLRASSS
jgi:hypothetical protein